MGHRRSFAAAAAAAVLASCALAGQASAAAPEFGRCVKVAKGMGNYTTFNCTTQGTGSTADFEWLPGAGTHNKFTLSTVAGKFVLIDETHKGTKITCSTGTAEGEYSGTDSVKLLARFEGCKTSGGQVNSPGEPAGVVVFKPWTGVLGVVKKGETAVKNKVALDFSPEEAGGPAYPMESGGLRIEVTGSVISHELSANAMRLSSAFKFLQTKGKQKPEAFEGLPRDVLETSINGGPGEQSGLGWETTQTNEEKIEVNTVF